MTPGEGFAQAGDVRLHYLQWDGSGPPVVLLHATGFLARLWQPVAERLAGRFHVYAYDARGHGDSDKPTGPPETYGWERFAADLRALLDALGLRGAIAVGHSMGGASAAHVAAAHPEYVAAAVLVEPIIFPPEPEGRPNPRKLEMVDAAARRRMVWSSPDQIVRTYRKRPAFTGWREDILRLYAEHGTLRRPDGRYELKCPGRIEAQVFAGGPSKETWDRAPEIRCPTVVMRGATTAEHLAWAAEGTATRIPGARLVTVPGSDHFLPMEDPDAVVQETMRLVEELGAHG